MRTTIGLTALFVAGLAAAQPSSPDRPVLMSTNACAVWARELSFAKSAEVHDLQEFAEHVHPAGVFISGNTLICGRNEIAKAWQGLVEDTGPVSLRWHPSQVTIAEGNVELAISTGPAWFIDKRPDAKNKYLRSIFVSTWKRDSEGVWHVLYDAGGDLVPVNEAEFEANRYDAGLSLRIRPAPAWHRLATTAAYPFRGGGQHSHWLTQMYFPDDPLSRREEHAREGCYAFRTR